MKNYLEFKRCCLSRGDMWYRDELVDLAKRLELSEIASQLEHHHKYRWWKEEVVEYVESIFTELKELKEEQDKNLRLYIAVLDRVPDFIVPTLVAHSVLGAHLAFTKFTDTHEINTVRMQYEEWLEKSFKKCVVKVNDKEFEKISQLPGVYLGHENKTLGGIKSCAVIAPVENSKLPNVLKFAKLWKPAYV